MWLNNWIDARLKAVVDDANTDLQQDIQNIGTKLDGLPATLTADFQDLLNTAQQDVTTAFGGLLDTAKTDVTQAITEIEQGLENIPNLVNQVLSQGVLSAEQLTQLFTTILNPGTLAEDVAEAIKSLTGGLLLTKTKYAPPDHVPGE